MLFLARERDPNSTQSVGANDLDGLYHEYTELDVSGPSAERFQTLLKRTTSVLEKAIAIQSARGTKSRRKFKKLDIISAFMFMQDISKNESFRFTAESDRKLAECILDDRVTERTGRSTSGSAIREHYLTWLRDVPESIGVAVDEKRLFGDSQKKAIYDRDGGKCGICGKQVEPGDDEYDHFPIPHHVGGKTKSENGRLVHARCHPRGRPTL